MFCFGIFIHLNTVSRKKAEDVTKKSPQPLDDRFYRFNGLRLGVYIYTPTIPRTAAMGPCPGLFAFGPFRALDLQHSNVSE